MNLCDLPDDILYLVLKAAMVYRGRIDLPLHLALLLLAVCRRLRHIALPVVYNTATIYVDGWCAPTDVPPGKTLLSLDLAASAGCVQCVRRAVIKVGYKDTPINGLRAAAKRLRAAAGKLAGVVTLNLYVVAEKRMLGWDGADATDHETDIKAIYDDIVAAIPGVLSLGLTLGSPDSVAQELGQRLVVHYSGQLENLSISGPVAVPRNTEFKQLKRLNLEYGCIGTSRPPRVSAAGLRLLRLQDRLTTTAWASFSAGVRDRELTFANLKVLSLVSLPSAAMPSFAAQGHSRTTWRLHFPSLQHAYIHCSQGPLPVLEWVAFPPRMISLRINVAPAVLRVVDEVVSIPAARHFALVVPRGSEDDSAVLAMVRRALEKAYKCETRELVVPGNTSPTVIGMVVSAPVTHLTLHLASMDVVTDLIRRTSNVTTLSIIRLSTDNVQPDILVPSPDSGHTVEPLNTGITELRLGWYSLEWQPDAVSAAKYLLLVIPSLLRLVASDALIQQLAEFTNGRTTCCPHQPNTSLHSRWW